VRVQRCFAFCDLSGFTRLTDTLGDEEAVAVLTRFRAIVRDVASELGVRVAKWLGDGAMFVGTEVLPVVEVMLELAGRLEDTTVALPLRAGIACGPTILFEGDDYVGTPVNLAARLCDAAGPGEVLATEDVVDAVGAQLKARFNAVRVGDRGVPGFVQPIEVWRYVRAEDVELPVSLSE
jgi:class 3 adenylate cyclase